MTAEELFDSLTAPFLGSPGVTYGRVWHNDGLKIDDKIYAMLVRGHLVVKVPADRVQALVAAGEGQPFEPRPGRAMREWVSVPMPADPGAPELWVTLMAEAKAFVGGLAGRRR
jgi:hypothetical protein